MREVGLNRHFIVIGDAFLIKTLFCWASAKFSAQKGIGDAIGLQFEFQIVSIELRSVS